MSAKENAAVGQLLELLEARYALRVLWALKDGHPQTFRLLQDSIGNITPNTLNTRIKDLREAGLIHHVASGYTVTPMGHDLLRRLGELQSFAGRWSLGQARPAVTRKTPPPAEGLPSPPRPAAAARPAASASSTPDFQATRTGGTVHPG